MVKNKNILELISWGNGTSHGKLNVLKYPQFYDKKDTCKTNVVKRRTNKL